MSEKLDETIVNHAAQNNSIQLYISLDRILALTGDSITTCDSVDPIQGRPDLQQCADLYLAGQDARSPLASPLYARFEHFPPMYIQVGEHETLRDDAIRLANRAKTAGNEVRLDVFPEMFHDFQLAIGIMPEADDAVERIRKWLRERFEDCVEGSLNGKS